MKAYKVKHTDHTDRADNSAARLSLGPACVYRVDPPIVQSSWDDEEPPAVHEYVWVSQAAPLGNWETYIFAADEVGTVTDWSELDGSRKGYITPDDLMREIGYEIVATANETATN